MTVYSPGRIAPAEEDITLPEPPPMSAQDLAFDRLWKSLLRIEIAVRQAHPGELVQLNGAQEVGAAQSETYRFQIDDSFVPVFAISIVNSSAATQYFNVESPASPMTMPIAAGAVFTYNLTQVKRMSLYSVAGVTVYPFPGQNVGGSSTGLYVQAWSNSEWAKMKGQGA